MTMIAAILSLVVSLASATLCFLGIIRSYRRVSGFPWLLSLGFAAAATAALAALRALLAS
jgi:hypothetical protein